MGMHFPVQILFGYSKRLKEGKAKLLQWKLKHPNVNHIDTNGISKNTTQATTWSHCHFWAEWGSVKKSSIVINGVRVPNNKSAESDQRSKSLAQ